MMLGLKIKILDENATMPSRAKKGDSGLDLTSVYRTMIPPGETRLLATGLAASVPEGYEIQIRPRSGIALKTELVIKNSPGTIDCNFRGEIKIIVKNTSTDLVEIPPNYKIAQMVVCPVLLWEPELVTDLDVTERGTGGFGSTGV